MQYPIIFTHTLWHEYGHNTGHDSLHTFTPQSAVNSSETQQNSKRINDALQPSPLLSLPSNQLQSSPSECKETPFPHQRSREGLDKSVMHTFMLCSCFRLLFCLSSMQRTPFCTKMQIANIRTSFSIIQLSPACGGALAAFELFKVVLTQTYK